MSTVRTRQLRRTFWNHPTTTRVCTALDRAWFKAKPAAEWILAITGTAVLMILGSVKL